MKKSKKSEISHPLIDNFTKNLEEHNNIDFKFKEEPVDYPAYDCKCDFSTLLHIHDCPHHPTRQSSIATTAAINRIDLKMPNLLRQPEDCKIVR